MIVVVLLIGVVLIVAAVRNSQGALFSALAQDVPAFVVWAAAIFAVGAIGFIPGLKPISRGLLALILVVLIMQNYQAIIGGFQSFWTKPPPASDTTQKAANDNPLSSIPSFGQLPSASSLGAAINDFGSNFGVGANG